MQKEVFSHALLEKKLLYLYVPATTRNDYQRLVCQYFPEFGTWVTVDYHPQHLEVEVQRENKANGPRIKILASQDGKLFSGVSSTGFTLGFTCPVPIWNRKKSIEISIDFNPPLLQEEGNVQLVPKTRKK